MFHSVTPTTTFDMMKHHNRSHGLLSSILLRKKESKISLRSCMKLKTSHSISTVSLPITIASSMASTISTHSHNNNEEEEEEEEEEKEENDLMTEPPKYEDCVHPYLSKYMITPREEEGNEILPEYNCTIEKTSYLQVKCEYSLPNIKSPYRSWHQYYIKVYGTMILAYSSNPNNNKKKQLVPIWKHSMHNSEVTVASDYLKDRFVLRLKIENGPQFLIKACTEKNRKAWIAVIESSRNISSDLDSRKMPQFITVVNRANRNNASRQVNTEHEVLL